MIGSVIVAGVVAVALAVVLVIVLRQQAAERREWAAERRALIDRAIASHVGEIVALDRQARPAPPRESTPRPEPVGLG